MYENVKADIPSLVYTKYHIQSVVELLYFPTSVPKQTHYKKTTS